MEGKLNTVARYFLLLPRISTARLRGCVSAYTRGGLPSYTRGGLFLRLLLLHLFFIFSADMSRSSPRTTCAGRHFRIVALHISTHSCRVSFQRSANFAVVGTVGLRGVVPRRLRADRPRGLPARRSKSCLSDQGGRGVGGRFAVRYSHFGRSLLGSTNADTIEFHMVPCGVLK